MTDNLTKPNGMFWGISIFALIWNLLGVAQYLMFAFMTDEQLAILPENEQELYRNIPAWATAAFAVAVWFGLLGSISLVMKKKWAKPLFAISLIAILVNMYHHLFMTKSVEVYGKGAYVMPVLVIIIGIFLYTYSKKAIAKGYLS